MERNDISSLLEWFKIMPDENDLKSLLDVMTQNDGVFYEDMLNTIRELSSLLECFMSSLENHDNSEVFLKRYREISTGKYPEEMQVLQRMARITNDYNMLGWFEWIESLRQAKEIYTRPSRAFRRKFIKTCVKLRDFLTAAIGTIRTNGTDFDFMTAINLKDSNLRSRWGG